MSTLVSGASKPAGRTRRYCPSVEGGRERTVPVRGSDLEAAAGLIIQDVGKDTGGVEPRPAEPVDGPVASDEGRGVHVADEAVVLDREVTQGRRESGRLGKRQVFGPSVGVDEPRELRAGTHVSGRKGRIALQDTSKGLSLPLTRYEEEGLPGSVQNRE